MRFLRLARIRFCTIATDRAHVATTPQSHIRRWLERILDLRGWNAAELARQAGVSPSTIGRALKGEKFVMTTATLSKIADAGQIALPTEITGSVRGMAEPEATPYGGLVPDSLDQKDNLDNWQLGARSLDLIGFLPGDIVQVDRKAQARTGDVVCVQIYDQHGGAETVFRSYEPPYVTTRTSDAGSHRKPQIVDGERVLIMGVVVKLVRLRDR